MRTVEEILRESRPSSPAIATVDMERLQHRVGRRRRTRRASWAALSAAVVAGAMAVGLAWSPTGPLVIEPAAPSPVVTGQVPNVVGLAYEQAVDRLRQAGVTAVATAQELGRYDTSGRAGVVLGQDPAPGTQADAPEAAAGVSIEVGVAWTSDSFQPEPDVVTGLRRDLAAEQTRRQQEGLASVKFAECVELTEFDYQADPDGSGYTIGRGHGPDRWFDIHAVTAFCRLQADQ